MKNRDKRKGIGKTRKQETQKKQNKLMKRNLAHLIFSCCCCHETKAKKQGKKEKQKNKKGHKNKQKNKEGQKK